MAATTHLVRSFVIAALAVLIAVPLHTPATAQTPPSFRDGTYLVNEQIPPGTYRSTGKGTRCYWERGGSADDIIDNHYGLAGGVVTIQASDLKFISKGCGPWVALDPANKPALPVAKQVAPKRDGFYVVGADIAPGLWMSTGTGSKCYWARQNITQDILDNEFSYPGGAVLIRPDDFEFYTNGCGVWTMLDVNNKPAQPLAKQSAPKRDGNYIMGVTMAPGRWRSNGQGSMCYWEKTTMTQDIMDNHLGAASVIVEITPDVFEFTAHGCGVWVQTNGVGTPINPAVHPLNAPIGKSCPSRDVCLTAPANGMRVSRGNVVVFTGTANHTAFARYQFLAGNNDAWGHIADFDKPVVKGELMELYTDTLPPGTYTIRLQVIDNTGNIVPSKADVTFTIQ